MNPPDEVPHSSVNGQTRTVDQGAARPKPKPRKGSTTFEFSQNRPLLNELNFFHFSPRTSYIRKTKLVDTQSLCQEGI